MSKFYHSTTATKYYWMYELPVVGLSLNYLPSVQRAYEMRLSLQYKGAFRDDATEYIASYWVAEWSINQGLFSHRTKSSLLKLLYRKRKIPTQLWVYGGVGYYTAYVSNVRSDQGIESNGMHGQNFLEHGLVLRLWHQLYYDDYRRGHWSVGILFNFYLSMTRVLDFKTIAVTDFYLIYPLQWRFCYSW